jgi:NosR/NirI family nitrous oxide reductase transcriptional regulator
LKSFLIKTITIFLILSFHFGLAEGKEAAICELDCSSVLKADSYLDSDDNIVEAYKNEKLVGYVFLTSDLVDLVGYSGKPIEMLVGMDVNGTITGVRVVAHSEPIMLVGIPEEALVGFVEQYIGKNVKDRIRIGGTEEAGYEKVDSVTGATLTAVQAGATIMESAKLVAIKQGILVIEEERKVRISEKYEKKTWEELLREGSIANLYVSARDVGKDDTGEPWMDLYFGYINQPTIGRNILGNSTFKLITRQFNDSHLILVVGRGRASFKGKAYARGGIFDRVQIEQGFDTFIFTDRDYSNIYSPPEGIPYFKERVVFAIKSSKFDPTKPFTLSFLTEGKSFSKEYRLPEKYVIREAPGRALWMDIWLENLLPFLIGAGVLGFVVFSFTRRRYVVKRRNLARRSRYLVMLVSLVYLGVVNPSLPSITQVLNPLIQKGLSWSLYLSDPLIFGLFVFLIVAAIFSGRVFCGEICPYGSLIEFLYEVVPLKKEIPRKIHDKLLYLKYAVLAGLVAAALYAGSIALELAEVEPFKTTFYVRDRPWFFLAYAGILLLVSAINNRFFCKYLCPLGALTGLISHLQVFKIKRHKLCGKCRICEKECPWQVIEVNGRGRINSMECLRCGECEMNYYDEKRCPALIKKRRKEQ